MATYLVTGAAGFIGSNLVRALLARGESVRGVDDLSSGRRENIEGLAFDFVEADVTSQGVLPRLMRGADYVLHQAAIPSVPRSVEAPLASHHAGATATLMALEAAREARVRRFVYASSSSAYGDTPVLPKVETMATQPLSPYAISKLAGEHYCVVYHRLHGVPAVALRYFNIFGPRQDPTNAYAAVIAKFVDCLLRGEAPPIYGDGRQTRDFTYVDNAVEANLLACTAPGAPGQVINVACGTQTSLLRLVELLNAILGTDLAPMHHPGRAGDVRDSVADISRARAVLGYCGAVSLEEGLRRYVEWFRGTSAELS